MDSLYVREIREQPQALREMVGAYFEDGEKYWSDVERLYRDGKCDGVTFTGMGSSYFASYISVCALARCRLPSSALEAGELLHYGLDSLSRRSLIVAVSQSGESIETIKAAEALSKRREVVAILHRPNSTLSRIADLVLPIFAGEEQSTATKTYTNTLAVLLIFADMIAGRMSRKLMDDLYDTADRMEDVLRDWEEWIRPVADFLGEGERGSWAEAIDLLARGPSLSTARQGALVLRETVHVFAHGMSCASFRHGPFEMVGDRHRAIVFAGPRNTSELNVNLAREMADRGSRVVLISDGSYPPVRHRNLYPLQIPSVSEETLPILEILPVELLSVLWAKQRGRIAGQFVHGSKVTVKE